MNTMKNRGLLALALLVALNQNLFADPEYTAPQHATGGLAPETEPADSSLKVPDFGGGSDPEGDLLAPETDPGKSATPVEGFGDSSIADFHGHAAGSGCPKCGGGRSGGDGLAGKKSAKGNLNRRKFGKWIADQCTALHYAKDIKTRARAAFLMAAAYNKGLPVREMLVQMQKFAANYKKDATAQLHAKNLQGLVALFPDRAARAEAEKLFAKFQGGGHQESIGALAGLLELTKRTGSVDDILPGQESSAIDPKSVELFKQLHGYFASRATQ